jgi:hypothetical protein
VSCIDPRCVEERFVTALRKLKYRPSVVTNNTDKRRWIFAGCRVETHQFFAVQESGYGLGCVKTRARGDRTELFSLLSSPNSGR